MSSFEDFMISNATEQDQEIYRWRERAQKAEARVRELEAQRIELTQNA